MGREAGALSFLLLFCGFCSAAVKLLCEETLADSQSLIITSGEPQRFLSIIDIYPWKMVSKSCGVGRRCVSVRVRVCVASNENPFNRWLHIVDIMISLI